MAKTLIFDFDGVIHDTFTFHHQKIQKFSGVLLSEQEFRDIHNENFIDARNTLKQIAWAKYRDFIFEEYSNLVVEPLVKEAVLTLAKRYGCFIITSGSTRNISSYLTNNGMKDCFKKLYGGGQNKSKEERFRELFWEFSVSAEDCIFITDTLGDILEARKCGIQTIAVENGFHPPETLAKGNPLHSIPDITHLPQVLCCLQELRK